MSCQRLIGQPFRCAWGAELFLDLGRCPTVRMIISADCVCLLPFECFGRARIFPKSNRQGLLGRSVFSGLLRVLTLFSQMVFFESIESI